MVAALSLLSLLAFGATLYFAFKAVVGPTQRLGMLGKALLAFLGWIATGVAVMVVGETQQGAPQSIMVDSRLTAEWMPQGQNDWQSCSSDYRLCVDEWQFKRYSALYFSGREACKEAAAQEARGHAESGYRGMTGVIKFGPEPYEKLVYNDWQEDISEGAMVMKDEEMTLQVYGSAWAEGRSVCLFKFDSEAVEMITVGFD